MGKLYDQMFVAQTTLEAWVDSGKADFDGATVVLRSAQVVFDLEPGVRFLTIVEGATRSILVGKVLPEARIGELGGELLGDSVIFGDVAFHVRPGYIATRRKASSPASGIV